jgi:chromosome segregation ATPase
MINKIDRKTVTAILLFLAAAVVAAYSILHSRTLSLELKRQKGAFEQNSKETVEIKKEYDKIKNDLAKLKQEYESARSERDNTFSRAKELLAENQRLKESRASLESSKENSNKEMQLLEKQRSETLEQNLTLKEQIKDFQTLQKQLIKEKEQLQVNLTRALEKSGIKKMEEENASFKAAAKSAEAKLSQKETEAARLKESESKFKAEAVALSAKVEELNKNYAEAIKKNREFEKKVSEAPAKFTEIARQNRALIKSTANLHYNAGVFYTKQKEYSRAAAEFEKAIELVPDDAYSHFNLGYIYAEYVVDRPKAIEHFKAYLRSAKKEDKDVDWVKKYILTWESWSAKQPME